ncbi:hypothetical protein [Streptomyces sp. CBMA123]|uniref:hypothetical protein n=1 Tax=Streptomyces sp. CBMA123 TaxID=1896313 RepID=UPI001661DF29|nr:hypothetical protein [Streptomyces sp. CBMA123]MBD0690257.1 hypothetical protein [Streptomyces sp. CBMA123]
MTADPKAPPTDGAGGADGGRTVFRVPRPERAHAERIAALRQARLTAAPAHLPTEHEQAAFELGLVVALVLGAPCASRGLDLLVNARRIQPEGAEVFAALLYATGKEEGAEFWWRFAAGSGSGTAAYCLHLHHLMLGETDDADYWRAWSEQLSTTEHPPGPGPLRMRRPLLPEDVRRDILSRVHRGLAPQLPPALVAVIDRLPLQDGDEEEAQEVPNPWGLTSGATSACSWELPWAFGEADREGGPDPSE